MPQKNYFLRDAIHSDIAFDQKYFELISTAEFQRLSRIKQLSSEYLVFPTALHNRFSHSIGTFFVMGRLLHRLEAALEPHGVAVTQEQKDLALCSALLHDIGHGPFSHTFEKISTICSHERWTAKILLDESTEIHHALCNNFSRDFIDKLVRIFSQGNEQEDNILTLISQLISSQMDADRMDYLLRDSYFTGVSTGLYDLHRLIEAIDVTKVDGRLRICVSEKYLSSIEEYIMARYYMHKEAYQHPLKRQLEHIIQMIFVRARELYERGDDIELDPIILGLFNEQIDVPAYLQLDDIFLMYHMSKWRKHQDFVLSSLCKAFVDRKKFIRYRGATGESLLELLSKKRAEKGQPPLDWEKEYCYIKDEIEIPIYNKSKDNIWVKLKSGEVVDITEASFLFGNMDTSRPFVRSNEYYHAEMLRILYGIEPE